MMKAGTVPEIATVAPIREVFCSPFGIWVGGDLADFSKELGVRSLAAGSAALEIIFLSDGIVVELDSSEGKVF